MPATFNETRQYHNVWRGWTNESLHSVLKTDDVDVSAYAFVIDERTIYTYMIP